MTNVESVFDRLVRKGVIVQMMKEIEELEDEKNCVEGLKLSWWIEREFDFELSEEEEQMLNQLIDEKYQVSWI